MKLPEIRLADYTYELPDERIAKYPLADRAGSRLLVYRQGQVQHEQFRSLKEQLPPKAHLVFNDTKVIPARLVFQKETGARIEVFLLTPLLPSPDMAQAMAAQGTATWQCMVGNLKRWKGETLERTFTVGGQELTLRATLEDREQKRVRFEWTPAEVAVVDWVEAAGQLPLPPYLEREAEPEDRATYQTVYSATAGAVAAPTAGLHFTEEILGGLQAKGFTLDYLTLHVSAGTFQPIKVEKVTEHPMHAEQMVISRANLEGIIQAEGPVIAVGTTALRTLESVYWYGVQLLETPQAPFWVPKLAPYEREEATLPTRNEALQAVLDHLHAQGADAMTGSTEIFCFPGYQFRVIEGLVTNFHQPGSTLLLLIGALVGPDWQRIYAEALSEGYRFLSYGDSSLLLP